MGGLLGGDAVAAPAVQILPSAYSFSRWEDLGCHDIAVGDAGTTFAAVGGGGVAVLDASLNPLGRVLTTQPDWWVAASGSLLATGLRGGDLELYDVRDPARPVLTSRLSLGHPLTALEFAGGRLYAADDRGAFHILDVRDPAALKRLGGFPDSLDDEEGHVFVHTEPENVRFVVRGTIAYVVGNRTHLRVLDVSNPEKIRLLGALTLAAPPIDIAQGGEHLFVSLGIQGVSVFDFAGNGLPSLALTLRPLLPANLGRLAARADGNRVAVRAGPQGVAILERGGTLGWQWSFLPDAPAEPPVGEAIRIAGDRCLVTWTGWVVQRQVEASGPPGQPEFREVGSGGPYSLRLRGDRLYVQSFETDLPYQGDRVAVLDIQDRLHPRWLGSVVGPRAGVSALAITPTLLGFLNVQGLFLASITNLNADGNFLGHLELTNTFSGLEIVGEHAYLSTSDAVVVADCHDPAHPRVVAQVPAPRVSRIVSDGRDGLVLSQLLPEKVVRAELADPANPRLSATYQVPTDERVWAMAAVGERAYLVLRKEIGQAFPPIVFSRLAIMELAASGVVRELGSFPLRSGPYAIQVVENRAVVACEYAGAFLLDVTDPAKVRELAPVVSAVSSFWNMDPRRGTGLGFDGSTVFQADPRTGVGMYGTGPGRGVVVNVTGLDPGTPFDLESTDGLLPPNWTRVSEVRTNATGSVVVDPRTNVVPQRYYRLRTGR